MFIIIRAKVLCSAFFILSYIPINTFGFLFIVSEQPDI